MHTPIPDLHHGVERPIIKAVVCQLRDEKIIPGWERYSYQPVLQTRNTEGGATPFMFKSEGYMSVSADISMLDGGNISNATAMQYGGVLPIFLDDVLKIALQPVYTKMYAEIELAYHTTSRELLAQWKNNILENRMLGADRWTHNVQYSYRVPGECGTLLWHVHEAMEKKAGYGDDFSTYVHKHMVKGTMSVEGGNHQQLNVTELQTKVLGLLDEELSIEERDNQYVGTAKYKIWFSMPRSIISIYDVQVHQTLLPKKYLPKILSDNSSMGILKNQDRTLLKPITPHSDKVYKEVSLTPFDASELSSPPAMYRIVWRALLTLDKGEAGEILCNLRDLPKLVMCDWMLCLIENFRVEAVQPYRSPFIFSLHRGTDLMDVTHLELDEHLNLISRRPLNLRDTWHISMSVSMAPQNIIGNRHRRFCERCPDSIKHLEDLVVFANTGHVRTRVNIANVRKNGICTSPGIAMYTVESVIIQSFRKGYMPKGEYPIRS